MTDPLLQVAKYIPSQYDIGHVKHALQMAREATAENTAGRNQIDYALKLVEAWPRPGDDHGFSDRDIAEMDRLGKHD